jgi:hypothetical protein
MHIRFRDVEVGVRLLPGVVAGLTSRVVPTCTVLLHAGVGFVDQKII